MNELTNTRLFALLSEPSQVVSTNEIQNAYGNFIQHVEMISTKSDYTIIYRNLSNTRIELEFLNLYEQEKKCT